MIQPAEPTDHTGQHYGEVRSSDFVRLLEFPQAVINLDVATSLTSKGHEGTMGRLDKLHSLLA